MDGHSTRILGPICWRRFAALRRAEAAYSRVQPRPTAAPYPVGALKPLYLAAPLPGLSKRLAKNGNLAHGAQFQRTGELFGIVGYVLVHGHAILFHARAIQQSAGVSR